MTTADADRIIDLCAGVILHAVQAKTAVANDDTVTALFRLDDVIELAGQVQRIAGRDLFPGVIR